MLFSFQFWRKQIYEWCKRAFFYLAQWVQPWLQTKNLRSILLIKLYVRPRQVSSKKSEFLKIFNFLTMCVQIKSKKKYANNFLRQHCKKIAALHVHSSSTAEVSNFLGSVLLQRKLRKVCWFETHWETKNVKMMPKFLPLWVFNFLRI